MEGFDGHSQRYQVYELQAYNYNKFVNETI